jgi:hypothetical protein
VAKSLSGNAFSQLPQHYPKGCPQNMGIKLACGAGPNLRADGNPLSRKGFLHLPQGYP